MGDENGGSINRTYSKTEQSLGMIKFIEILKNRCKERLNSGFELSTSVEKRSEGSGKGFPVPDWLYDRFECLQEW